MNVHKTRSQQIVQAMSEVEAILSDGMNVENLNKAKVILSDLASKRDLFPKTDFPWPSAEENNHMYCVYRHDDGQFALYVDVLFRGVSSIPHDHGDSWAIVSCIEGEETHHLYSRNDGREGPGPAQLAKVGQIKLAKGESVSMLKGGIHSIETDSSKSVMMLHCYGRAFEDQEGRLEFDQSAQKCDYGTDGTGAISQLPLHYSVKRKK